MKKRYHVIFEGQVQGVGFRWVCMQYAEQLGITGTVRNMSNGMVDLFAQGEEESLDRLLQLLKQRTGWIRIDDMTIREVPLQEHETGFRPVL